MLGYYVDNWRYGLPADYWDTYPARISAVTRRRRSGGGPQVLGPARLQIVAVGDATRVADGSGKGRGGDLQRGRQSDEVTAALLRGPIRGHPLHEARDELPGRRQSCPAGVASARWSRALGAHGMDVAVSYHRSSQQVG